MADTTPNLGLTKPTVGADADLWGGYLNDSLDVLDLKVLDKTTGGSITGNLSISGTLSAGATTLASLAISITLAVTGTSTLAAASATNLSYTGTLTGGTGIINIGSGQIYKGAGGNVGIGTSAPNARLDVSGGDIQLKTNATYLRVTDSLGATFRVLGTNSGNTVFIGPIDPYAGGDVLYGVSANVTAHRFSIAGSDRLRLTSAGRLKVSNTGNTFGSVAGLGDLSVTAGHLFQEDNNVPAIYAINSATGSSASGVNAYLATGAAGNYFRGFLNNALSYQVTAAGAVQSGAGTAALPAFSSVGDTDTGAFLPAANTWAVSTGGAEKFRVSPAGNLLVGTTTDAGFEVQTRKDTAGAIDGVFFASNQNLTANSRAGFIASTANGDWKLLANRDTYFQIDAPTIPQVVRIASGGYFKASNTGTYLGNVGSDASTASFHHFQSNQNSYTIYARTTSDSATSIGVASVFETSATAGLHFVGRNGNALVYQVLADGTVQNSTGLYQTISDRRVKDDITPLTNSGDFIDALKPSTWTWLPESNRTGKGSGFVADEFQQVSPSSVTGNPNAVDEKGEPIYQAIDSSTDEVIANLVAEIQSLRKRISQLEAK